MLPTLGRTVHYKLTQQDAEAINHRRTDRGIVANMAAEGQTFPAEVVRTFGGEAVNLQVHLDGPDIYWATSRCEGDVPGRWIWPPRV